jgi:hypothetical protein
MARHYRPILCSLFFVATCAFALLGSWVGAARASDITLVFEPTNTFSGTAPGGPATSTILSAEFKDVAGGVQLILTSNLAAGENLDPGKTVANQRSGAWYFNFNPMKDSLIAGHNLTFTLTNNPDGLLGSAVSQGADAFKADGDGFYDYLFTYQNGTKPFTTGQTQTWLITDSSLTTPISAVDFTGFKSTPGGGAGTWLAAVHVQNTPNGGSGSAFVGAVEGPGPLTPTPEPSSMVLFGGIAGLGVIVGCYRCRRARAA